LTNSRCGRESPRHATAAPGGNPRELGPALTPPRVPCLPGREARRRNFFVPGAALVLALGVAALYAPAVDFGYIALDDRKYTESPLTAGGLTLRGVRGALTSFDEFWIR